MTSANPPRWAQLALRVILKRRDRDTIAGDGNVGTARGLVQPRA